MWEIISRELPFQEFTDAAAVEEAVKEGQRPAIPPHCNETYATLTRVAWAPEAKDRPSFAVLVKELEALRTHYTAP